jgi:hypothetical protein
LEINSGGNMKLDIIGKVLQEHMKLDIIGKATSEYETRYYWR